MCTGNTTSSTDITDQQCIDNRYSGLKEEPNTITISAPETQYNDCCISINGMCTGNTDINEDVSCTGNRTLIPDKIIQKETKMVVIVALLLECVAVIQMKVKM